MTTVFDFMGHKINHSKTKQLLFVNKINEIVMELNWV